ncbi:hypothetical protein HKX48_001296 [Thoreauomyces humboldtii]|nr:hypothetical protein HKX48_001296 [Thoreauomyces humboldtii]
MASPATSIAPSPVHHVHGRHDPPTATDSSVDGFVSRSNLHKSQSSASIGALGRGNSVLPFDEHFWGDGDEGIEKVLEKTDLGVQDTETIIQIFLNRAALETDYGTRLAALGATAPLIHTPGVCATVHRVNSLVAAAGRAHGQYASKIEADLVSPLRALLAEQKSIRRRVADEYEAAGKVLDREAIAAQKVEKEYVARSKEHWKAVEAVSSKTDRCKQEAESAGAEYQAALATLATQHDGYVSALSTILTTLQSLELTRLETYHDLLTQTTVTQTELLGNFSSRIFSASQKAVLDAPTPTEECNAFVQGNQTACEKPRSVVFRSADQIVAEANEVPEPIMKTTRSGSFDKLSSILGFSKHMEKSNEDLSAESVPVPRHAKRQVRDLRQKSIRSKRSVSRKGSQHSIAYAGPDRSHDPSGSQSDAPPLPSLPALPTKLRGDELISGLPSELRRQLSDGVLSQRHDGYQNQNASSATSSNIITSPGSTHTTGTTTSLNSNGTTPLSALLFVRLALPPGIVPPSSLPYRPSPPRAGILLESMMSVTDEASSLINPQQPWESFYCTLETTGWIYFWKEEEDAAWGEMGGRKPVGAVRVDRKVTRVEYGVAKKAMGWATQITGREKSMFTVTVLPSRRVLFDAGNETMLW